MSSQVYWIEDELDLLQWILGRLAERAGSVKKYRLASEVLDELKGIKAKPGPIILDLWLPSEEREGIRDHEGPQLGIWLLGQLRRELGPDWPIFILTGNLSVVLRERLRELGIPDDRVYAKPIIEEADQFVQAVVALAEETSPSESE